MTSVMRIPLTLPNLITLGRLLLSFGVFALLAPAGEEPRRLGWAFALFVIAGVTDFWDGYLARRFHEETDFGRVADPMVDKVLVCGTMIFLCRRTTAAWLGMTPVVVGIVVARELVVTVLRARMEKRGIPFPASRAGKAKLFLQAVMTGAVLLALTRVPGHPGLLWAFRIGIWAMVAATLYSGLQYAAQAASFRSGARS